MARRRDYSSCPHCTCKTRTRSLYLVPWNAATLKPVFRFKRHVHINDQKASSSLQIVRGFDHAYFWHETSRNVALNIQVHAKVIQKDFKYTENDSGGLEHSETKPR